MGTQENLNNSAPSSASNLNIEDYISDLAEFDLTEAQKVELLQTLWLIMSSFVRMGIRVDICGALIDQDSADAAGAIGLDFDNGNEGIDQR